MLTAVVAAGILCGCSPKKNTAATRNYQAFITRYNIHYNGQTHYDETLDAMERDYADDFTRLLPMHPAEARGRENVPQPQGSFTRSIEKAQKAIQLRSIKRRPRRQAGRGSDPEYREWLRREEYNPFLHNSWMLMARSQYMDGDFLAAAATFHYIATHFRWLPQTVAEARLWQARCYCAAGLVNEAEATMNRVRDKELTTKKLIALREFVRADILINRGDYKAAIEPLQTAIDDARGAQRTRLTFLLGQVAERAGDKERARQAFKRAGRAFSAPYRTRFNARIAASATLEGASPKEIEKEIKVLQRMTRYERNDDYLDQIYYALGNLHLAEHDSLAAMHDYAEAVAKSRRRGIEMALAELRLGEIYFERGEYDLAQPCYAQAVSLLPTDYPELSKLKMRSDVLDDLALHSRAVALNDSLLRLAAMPPQRRLEIVDSIISALLKQEKAAADEQRRIEAENRAESYNAANRPTTSAAAPLQFQLNTDKSWYFYNPTTRNAGSAEFRRLWGNRKLEDDWRRRNRNNYSMPGADEEGESEVVSTTDSVNAVDASTAGAQPDSTANGPHQHAFYLKNIPLDSASVAGAHEAIQSGLFNMGLILKDRLEDFPATNRSWQRLLRDYPDNIYRLDVYHNLYLMAARRGDEALAEHYRRLIAGEFPESPEGVAMADPRYLDNLREMHSRQEELYGVTWKAYLANRNDSVHAAVAYATEHYPTSRILPKFMFLDALTYVSDGNTEEFLNRLRDIVERYPDADVSALSAAWIKAAGEGRRIVSESGNVRGLLWATRLTADSVAAAAEPEAEAVSVTLDVDAPRLVIVIFPRDTFPVNEMLYEVARYNFNSFSVADFDLETMSFGNLGLVIVRSFPNLADAAEYADRISGALQLPEQVRTLVIPEEDWKQLLIRGGSLEQYTEALRAAADKDVHESVLPPDEYPPADEMYDEMYDELPDELPDDEPQNSEES